MPRLISISFTSIDSPGGVPRWCRDFKKCFPESVHYSWDDYVKEKGNVAAPEWDKARILGDWLIQTGKRKEEDVVVGDGWWAGEYWPKNTISVCHGIWSHLIKEEADEGKQPDFPQHHEQQIKYRKLHLERGGKLVSVSLFIAQEMKRQWNFDAYVINNAIDLEKFKPTDKKHPFKGKQLVIHGVNDKGNTNKGWEHIEKNCKMFPKCMFMSLDEAHALLSSMMGRLDKYEVLAMADWVLIPSNFEGNSYFALECLASNVPVVAYDVGLFHELNIFHKGDVGVILPRKNRSVDMTQRGILVLQDELRLGGGYKPRETAERYSIDKFNEKWKKYLKENYDMV